MDCIICKHGETKPGKVIQTFHRGGTVVVVKDIPADVCGACGEPYISAVVTRVIQRWVDDAVGKGIELEILRYAA
jgi:YgiT-type zinc finger domain-containing protein